jgi:hypothetical protein
LARELGDLRLECIGWGNLGTVHEKLGRFDEARIHYESAMLSARGLGDRRSEGQFLGCPRLAACARGAIRRGQAMLRPR